MIKLLSTCLFALAITCSLQAQQLNCGVDAAAGAIIKQRLMDNRNALSKQQVHDLLTNRVITYIPLTIHNVKNTAGEGRTGDDVIMGFLCGLNAIYSDQDVQFFIHGQINELTNNFIDANSSTVGAKAAMFSNKVAGTMNLYIGQSTYYPGGGSLLSYYDPNFDFIFLQKAMVSAGAKTEAHEIAHYLSINHTFYGWEGIDAEAQYNGVNAPASVGGEFTERVTRGAGNNCSVAADGFCDTEADYHSTAAIQSCSHTPLTLDPTGATLDPDESNLMSYYSDNCQGGFSAEQKAAIAVDIALRSWVTNTPPSTATVTGVPSVFDPIDGGSAGIAGSSVRLDWDNIPGATWYYLEVIGTSIPGIWLPNPSDVKFKGIVTSGNSHYDLPTNDLTVGLRYAWRVKALNQYSTCALTSSYAKFEATATTSIEDLPVEKQMTLTVNSNPITANDIPLMIHSAKEVLGTVRIYAMDGRELITLAKQNFSEGQSLVQIPASDMPNGMYLAVVSTEEGSLQQKFVIQR